MAVVHSVEAGPPRKAATFGASESPVPLVPYRVLKEIQVSVGELERDFIDHIELCAEDSQDPCWDQVYTRLTRLRTVAYGLRESSDPGASVISLPLTPEEARRATRRFQESFDQHGVWNKHCLKCSTVAGQRLAVYGKPTKPELERAVCSACGNVGARPVFQPAADAAPDEPLVAGNEGEQNADS